MRAGGVTAGRGAQAEGNNISTRCIGGIVGIHIVAIAAIGRALARSAVCRRRSKPAFSQYSLALNSADQCPPQIKPRHLRSDSYNYH